jgi:hypothetical protein
MLLAASALVAAVAFGSPLVSILFVGLLLLCPLVTWIPFRVSRRPEHSDESATRESPR